MYSKCGDLGVARKVFNGISVRDVVSWTTMINGLVENGMALEAIGLFGEMVDGGGVVEFNEAAAVSVLKACAKAGALGVGERVAAMVRDNWVTLEGNVGTALIDMYAKCGCLESAKRVFDEVSNRTDIVTWTAMISGLASHGKCREAIELFDQMREIGLRPDERTMTAILTACRNAGWVREGYEYFRTMKTKFGIWPTIQHYGCAVDLLTRAGRLNEAEEFINKMPIEPNSVLWRSLIWAFYAHNNLNRAERLIKHLKGLNTSSDDCGSLVLIGNVYASARKWRDKAKVRNLMSKKGLVKPPGWSRIELDGEIYEFIVGDSSHPEAERIYTKLGKVDARLREKGYRPKLSGVLLEIEDEEKAFQLSHHSKKLALALGLVKTGPRTKIRIVKNLRSCEDYHEFMKAISRVYQREIIVRDRIRFHHFSNGDCSCQDHW